MHLHVRISSSRVLTNKFRSSRVRALLRQSSLAKDLFTFTTTFYDHFKYFFLNSDHADESLSGEYLNDSQCTPVKPVELRNVYDFPFGAKKKVSLLGQSTRVTIN